MLFITGRDNEDQQKEIDDNRETASPLFDDTKQASKFKASSMTKVSETTVSNKGLERPFSAPNNGKVFHSFMQKINKEWDFVTSSLK